MCKYKGRFNLYADDTAIYNSDSYIKTLEENMNHDLNIFSAWAYKNSLTINETKTKFMLIQSKTQEDFQPRIRINNVILERVHQYDYLGMTLHNKLTQLPHLNKLIAKT